MWAGVFAPTGWLLADGTSVSRTTYANLYNVVVPSLGVATITIATPGVVTCNSHGLIAGDTVIFTTTGSLPTGLLNSAYYFVIATGLTSNAFQLSASDGGAAINTTGSQSGVHTLRRAPYGIADATHFWLPPMPGRVPVGRDSTQTEFVRLGKGGGSKTHTLATGEIPSHNHTQNAHNHGITDPTHAHEQNVTADVAPGSGIRTDYNTDASSATFDQGVTTNSSGTGISINNATPTNNVTGGGGAHNNLQPYLAVNFIIKT
jgi:microcystin-dependent protein